MKHHKGFGILSIILIIFALLALGTVGAGAAIVLGKAPLCPNAGTTARSEKMIGDILENGSVTITDGEATTLAQSYMGRQVTDARVCFTKGAGHLSGTVNLGVVKPTFYLTSGVDLTSAVPKVTNLGIQLGSLPNVPALSSLAQGALNQIVSGALSKIELKKQYSATFGEGSVTITSK